MDLVIGIDGGTESLRARVYNLKGVCLGTAAEQYETKFASGARAEQEPEDWWRAPAEPCGERFPAPRPIQSVSAR